MKLTVKQKKFADEYIICGNATEAAIKAGYSKKTATVMASENLTKPNIKNYIEERLEAIQSEKIADQREVMEFLTAVMRGETTEATLIGKGYGEQAVGDVPVSMKERIKAGELIGKRHGMWTEKVDVSSENSVVIIDDSN